jgi:hypothetical protein
MEGSRRLAFFLGCAAALVVSSYGAPAWADPAVGTGVLVLRNGSVLEGEIRQAGDYYHVAAANATLQVHVDQVDMFSASLEAACESRRERMSSTSDAHLELARWCLRHHLLDQASQEVAAARTIEPHHADLAALDLQVRQIIELRATRDTQRTASSNVVQAAAVAPVAQAAPFAISAEAQARFVRSIQPMLVRSCATSGCHQPGGPRRLQLDRWALTGNGNATLIRRNLAAVLNQIRTANPADSPLATWGGRVHGSSGALSRSLEPHQMRLLNEWLNEACGVKPPEPEAPQDAAPNDAANGPHSPPTSDASTKPAKQSQAFVPRDAFDAEIFNHRQAQRAKAAAAPPAHGNDSGAPGATSAPEPTGPAASAAN